MRAIAIVSLVVALCGIARAQEGLPANLLAEVKEPKKLAAGRYEPALLWEGKAAPHKIGRAVVDPGGAGGRVWEAKLQRDEPGMMVYGPYADLPAGDYVAFLRLKAGADAGEEVIAVIDACGDYGQKPLRTHDLTGSDVETGRYVRVPIRFHHDGGKLECRVNWRGYETLRLDTIAVYRLIGAAPERVADRVAQPTMSGVPSNLELRPTDRPFPDIFPKSQPPAANMLSIDIRHRTPDWQLLYLSLQGLVNRAKPQIYCNFGPTDAGWLNWIRRNGWVKQVTPIAEPRALLSRFRSRFRGVVVTDPKLPATRNLACMLASVENCLVASPRIAKELKLPIVADLRGRWTTNVAAYRWAFDTLWPRLNHYVAACSYPDHLGLRDYLIQNRVFTFWLSGPIDGAKPYADPNGEVRLMEELLAKMPANMPIMSYPWAGKDVGIGEGPGVTLFAEFGKYLVGTIDCANLSVHSGIRAPKPRQKVVRAPRLQGNKVYLAFILSDGDNLPVLTNSNFPQLWKDPLRGKIPISWTISPSASILLPDVMQYYYTTATPGDSFLAAVSGVGYTYPDSYGKRFRPQDQKAVFDGFLDQTAAYMARCDLTSAWIMGSTRQDLVRRYAEKIPAIDAIFPDYGKTVPDYDAATYPTVRNVPVFRSATSWAEPDTREQRIARLVADIRSMTPPERPAFLHFFVLNWFSDLPLLQDVMRRLGPDYVAVRHDHLSALYKQSIAAQQVLVRAPRSVAAIEGEPITFEAAVHNTSGRPMAVDASVPTGLKELTIRQDAETVAPGDACRVTVLGQPAAARAQLEVAGPFGKRDRLVELRTVPRTEILPGLPTGIASLRFVNTYQAVNLPHNAGKVVDDAQAGSGKAWAIAPDDPYRGFVLFGPYAPLDKGRYLVLFRAKRTAEASGQVLTVDASTGGGQVTLGERAVNADDLPVGEYRCIPLVVEHPGGAFEARFERLGDAGLSFDCIYVWALD